MGKIPLKKDSWKTKSTIAVDTKMEKALDEFFKRFGDSVTVYKILAENIEKLE